MSLAITHPSIADLWDYKKNEGKTSKWGDITPHNIAFGVSEKYWFKAACGHSILRAPRSVRPSATCGEKLCSQQPAEVEQEVREYDERFDYSKFFPDYESMALPIKKRLQSAYRSYKDNSAGRRGLEFALDKETFFTFVSKMCSYCGIPPNPIHGLDRIDNDEGYVLGNILPCCIKCNKMKGTLTLDDFIDQCKRITDFMAPSEKRAPEVVPEPPPKISVDMTIPQPESNKRKSDFVLDMSTPKKKHMFLGRRTSVWFCAMGPFNIGPENETKVSTLLDTTIRKLMDDPAEFSTILVINPRIVSRDFDSRLTTWKIEKMKENGCIYAFLAIHLHHKVNLRLGFKKMKEWISREFARACKQENLPITRDFLVCADEIKEDNLGWERKEDVLQYIEDNKKNVRFYETLDVSK
jgi:hypothetical protein